MKMTRIPLMKRTKHQKLRRSQRWQSREQLRLQNLEMYCSWECSMLLFSSHSSRFIWLLMITWSETGWELQDLIEHPSKPTMFDSFWIILSPTVAGHEMPKPVKRWEISKAMSFFFQFWSQTKKPQAQLTYVWQAVAERNAFWHFKPLPSNLSGFRSDSQSDTKRYLSWAIPGFCHKGTTNPHCWPVARTPAPPALPTKNSRAEKRQAVHTSERYPKIPKTLKVEKAKGNFKRWMVSRVYRGFDQPFN